MQFEVLLIKSDVLSYDITNNVTPVEFTDNINVSGVCTFGTLADGDHKANPEPGDGVRVKCEGVTYFAGYVFKVSRTQEKEIKVTAYDQLRYLKASETYVFKNKTAGQIVTQLCSDFGLTPGVIEDTKYPLGVMTFDCKAMLDIIAEAVTKTLTATHQLYFLKDNAGKVELRNIQNCVSDLIIAPDSLMFAYSHEREIDSDTYNQIKLVHDNAQTGARELYVAQDTDNIKRWGTLQYYEKVDDGMNPEQIKQKADSLLFLKNRMGQKLSVDLLGEKSVRAGNMLYLSLPEEGVKKYLLCLSARHSFTNAAHTVKAELKLV